MEHMQHYEALRANALDSAGVPRGPLGMGVFLLRGMLGWMHALPTLETFSDRPATNDAPGLILPEQTRSDLVYVLADMTQAVLQGGTAA